VQRSALLVLYVSLAACQAAPAVNVAAEAEKLLAVDRAFAELSERSNPKQAFAAYMAPNGMLLPRSTEGAIEGYDKVIASFGASEDPGYRLLWQPQFAEVAAAGDMGWTWGQYQVFADGRQMSSGKYLNVWSRQADGAWKVRVDLGNQRPAAGADSP